MWVRGLKQQASDVNDFANWSHPVWVRGLKPVPFCLNIRVNVAPRVGAWIETCGNDGALETIEVAPRVGAWIETHLKTNVIGVSLVAPRVGAWIETHSPHTLPRTSAGRTLCGCVD